jgi:hypothetical protein
MCSFHHITQRVFMYCMAGGIVLTLPLFLLGNYWYRHTPPAGSVLGETLHIIWNRKCCGRRDYKGYSRAASVSVQQQGTLVDADAYSEGIDVITIDDHHSAALHARAGEAPDPPSATLTPAAQKVQDVDAALSVLSIFLPLPFFWAVFFQMYSIWVFEAQDMDLNVFGYDTPPALVTSLNSVFDILLIPVFAKCIYPCLRPTSLQKMGYGYLFVCLSLGVALYIDSLVEASPGEVSVLWIVPQVLLISVGAMSVCV